MAQPKKWLDEVIDALNELGGQAHLEEINERIKSRDIMDFEQNSNWESSVRKTLEHYSSDSNAYLGKKDIFYSVHGIGNGVWGIR